MRRTVNFCKSLALVLTMACGADAPLGPRGEATRADAQLWAAIVQVDGRVSIGFKEANAARGVDATGRNVTSVETAHAMKRLLLSRGMTFSWQSSGQAAVSGRLPLDLALVAELRRHPNIDYLEPHSYGTWH